MTSGTIGTVSKILMYRKEWRDVFAFNERKIEISVTKQSPLDDAIPHDQRRWPRAFTDTDSARAALWGERNGMFGPANGIHASPAIWRMAVEVEAKRRPFDPVRRYLESLEWDGVPRLSEWPTRYLGVTPDSYNQRLYTMMVARAWMISAVARAFDPGCQADHVLVLEGAQGAGKSSALGILAGDWFSDAVWRVRSNASSRHLVGPWIVELAELDAMICASIKPFITRRTERFRAPYGRGMEEYPRRSVFAATTNDARYLRDSTGNRRFWPIRCTSIDLQALREDRDQLWAEAVSAYRHGEAWHIEESRIQEIATHEQAGRQQDDPWDEAIGEYVAGLESVTVSGVLEQIGVPLDRRTQREMNRVARALLSLGFRRRHVRDGKARRRVYERSLP